MLPLQALVGNYLREHKFQLRQRTPITGNSQLQGFSFMLRTQKEGRSPLLVSIGKKDQKLTFKEALKPFRCAPEPNWPL